MLKIWAKIIVKEKIIKSKVFEFEGEYTSDKLYKYLSEICLSLDIPKPILLKKHQQSFERFKNTKFTKDDFIEKIDFCTFAIENATEDSNKKPITLYTNC